jgi:hypothetical protein
LRNTATTRPGAYCVAASSDCFRAGQKERWDSAPNRALGGAVIALLCSLYAGSAPAAQGPCATIRQLCETAGFVQGAAQSGNGLQRDCMQPILQAQAQRSAASRPLPIVAPEVVAACRAAAPESGRSTGTSNGGPSITVAYVPGSTHKINQLIGEVDRALDESATPVHGGRRARYLLRAIHLESVCRGPDDLPFADNRQVEIRQRL